MSISKRLLYTGLCGFFSMSMAYANPYTTFSNTISNSNLTQQLIDNKELTPEDWQLPQLTLAEKQQIIAATKTIFNELYVNYEQKKKEYHFDAREAANKLHPSMGSSELLRAVNTIYKNMHDYHTYYEYPVPARCVNGGFPIKVKLVYEQESQGKNQEKLIIVEKLTPTINSSLATIADQQQFKQLMPGDEIISISHLGVEGASSNTLTTREAIDALKKVTYGANPDATDLFAVEALFFRRGGFMQPPSGRFQLAVKKADTGNIQHYDFPWIASKAPMDICTKGENTLPQKTPPENIEKKIVEYKGKKFAVIRINAFVPQDTSSIHENYLEARKAIIKEVSDLRKFLINNREEVSGLIIDTRNGGGGYGVFPQLIANAFTKKYVSNFVSQPLITFKNRDTFKNLEFGRYFTRLGTDDPLVDDDNVIMTAPASATADAMDKILNIKQPSAIRYLEPASRFDEDENDALPPEYTARYKLKDTEYGTEGKFVIKEIFTQKPIALISNAICYSSCDIFTSLLKDYKIAKLFGETTHTGGGGANVVEWNSFAIPRPLDEAGNVGPVIPNAKVLPHQIRMRFAWNRIVRIYAEDQAKERYIEGVGVILPNLLKPTINDALNNGADAFGKIMDDMIENADSYPLNR